MDSKDFIDLCKGQLVSYWITKNRGKHVGKEDIFVVWYCKTLQNHKTLMSAPIKGFPYVEFTYNGDKDELYMDVYSKIQHECIEGASDIGIGTNA